MSARGPSVALVVVVGPGAFPGFVVVAGARAWDQKSSVRALTASPASISAASAPAIWFRQHLSIGREAGAFNLRLLIPKPGSNKGLGAVEERFFHRHLEDGDGQLALDGQRLQQFRVGGDLRLQAHRLGTMLRGLRLRRDQLSPLAQVARGFPAHLRVTVANAIPASVRLEGYGSQRRAPTPAAEKTTEAPSPVVEPDRRGQWGLDPVVVETPAELERVLDLAPQDPRARLGATASATSST